MSPSRATPTPFTATCLQGSAQTLAAAPRRGQPVCRTCRFAPCPSLPPSHPSPRTSHCLASGVPSHPHSCVCLLCVVHIALMLKMLSRAPPLWKAFLKKSKRDTFVLRSSPCSRHSGAALSNPNSQLILYVRCRWPRPTALPSSQAVAPL